MIDTYEKCISLFSRKNARILIVVEEDKEKISLWRQKNNLNVELVSLRNNKGELDLKQPDISHNKQFNDSDQPVEYDLIILDQICNSPLIGTKIHNAVWKNREEMFHALSSKTATHGCIILFSKNAACIRDPFAFFYALINLFIRTFLSGAFIVQLAKELKKAGFSQLACFYVYPELNTFSKLISDDKKAFQDAMTSMYGLPLDISRRPEFWLRWLGCYLRLDRWLLSCRMIWIRK
jgi:hypothetical protein